MNKSAIKKFATEARRELISRVGQRALKYGISDQEVGNPNDDSVGGHLLSSTEKKQRAALIEQIKEKGYEQVMEEVAYTWFNRLSALRFMEVNGYLPTRVRVFTDENNAFKPQILTEAIHMELDGLDMEKVYAYKEANDNDELYKYLLITQCNALNRVLPGMFQKIADYTELLFPDNLLREGSVVEQMITQIPEEDWQDQVQIIGWLYQYYNSEKKDDVFAALKKNVKITKENIPAATQLFTPDWIVRYMVENSLGRLWVEGHPNDKVKFIVDEREGGLGRELKSQWKYYLEEAEQEPDVQSQLASIREEYKALKPEDILCIDPCSGSGHILAYMFDVLVQIYESYGYTTRESVASIVENNIYGLDIDDRAAQLAYFAVMMKARQYDSRFFSRGIQPHVYAIVESNHVDQFALDYFCNGDAKLKETMDTIIEELHDAKEYGSILTVTPQEWSALYDRFSEIMKDIMFRDTVLRELLPLVQVAEALAQKYDVVCTNPPYMGSSGMSAKLSDFVKKNYPDSKSDLFACCIEKGNMMTGKNGFNCMVTMQSWMFLSSFEKMRIKILKTKDIANLMHMENMVMGIAFGTAVTAFRNNHISGYKGTYNHIKYEDIVDDLPKEFPIKANRFAQVSTENFSKIPGSPVAYWVSDAVYETYKNDPIGNTIIPRHGLATSDNDRFLKLWHEVVVGKSSIIDKCDFSKKWYPMNKGGAYRKWYGNLDWIINYENDGREIKAYATVLYRSPSRTIQNTQYYFLESITWSALTSGSPSFRWSDKGAIFGSGAHCSFAADHKTLLYGLGLMNSKINTMYLNIVSATLNKNVDDIRATPFIMQDSSEKIVSLVESCVQLSRNDWDSFETSWDFEEHPLVRLSKDLWDATAVGASMSYYYGGYPEVSCPLELCYMLWQGGCNERFNQLKANEEELNRIFIDIYGLQDELTPEVEDKDVTVRKADLERDIKSFISYAVGCIFGRYSLDVEELAYAGGDWDDSKYTSFPADKDNIIPICDDEYFDDDIVGRFVKFVEVVYGKETLEDNLKFIADALGGKGQPKEVIRNYFMKDFYKDHCKMYQKRPIYWLFDSGKKNGFKALIYMHRYEPDTIARIRTDYVHEQQARYRTTIADLETRIANASTSERVKLNKQLKTLNDQATEIHEYEEKIHHLADQMISIDLDDGVKKNYEIFKDVLAKIK
ncbi:BREX-1 system adenine-specific DNA-methyltransferase PglX [Peptostreptococcus anaerobius]|uniref:BREX-1 system adenine-specific DNA-methyltransferase PglX n=1 Tax=Peptostreptococcus anaerobius TaxID=1261 RepID=UPI00232ADF92|nr:BREX-1 system adenine-specific DNA-methyltransferase PglX [Peptostreptococcus anaerobius]MDB8821457.1 BREX-1 system adenine-specific DNA-methyltransferase PglX [Peptostreptococcus anaerobius]MDB8826173.1 BREX-1 system adenine-specific DNA-methyltransferase PglX [Peptostreptococcus anaerobius]MDB8827941.1 BREX-1 system adenine-specific DNA-methyltransferase PglX [Peptostreptococcus anaerobius]MDB8829789.1 BREX-1 system adenine-specific DNA-methyltransferase PglX [Peptostreptococcus anaerobius